MAYQIMIDSSKQYIEAEQGANLLEILHRHGFSPESPCGGNGHCGKCRVIVDGQEVLACCTTVDRDMVVSVPGVTDCTSDRAKSGERTASESRAVSMNRPERKNQMLTVGKSSVSHRIDPIKEGYLLAFDIGTTTVVGYLLDKETGEELAAVSRLNPQKVFGADVITRIRHGLKGALPRLTTLIRDSLTEITGELCRKSGVSPEEVGVVSVVGNPAMQQIFLGISPENLASIPFSPVLTRMETVSAKAYLPLCENAELIIAPDISGFVGADTLACVLAMEMDRTQEITLLVDIGTNGEMVLGNCEQMVSCSTAAGPALEGANIRFGMRGETGAIDHVWMEDGNIRCSVIGDTEAVGICGSGLIDAVAVALEQGLINSRGRVRAEDRCIHLTDRVYLTQEDIREVQMAKGAIAAGIHLMAEKLGLELEGIEHIYLAGAFGTYMDVDNACAIGLLPLELKGKIKAVGNAAGSGAKLLACDRSELGRGQRLARSIGFIELAAIPDFQYCYAENMYFVMEVSENVETIMVNDVTKWIDLARELGFTAAQPLKVSTLHPRTDVRAMCAEDKCRAYGKNWTCPPHCGTLEQCESRIRSYSEGILLQVVGKMGKDIDSRAYRQTEQRFLELFYAFSERIREQYPDALCLGAGGCRVCRECAWPEACRFPGKACSSMEAYGLFVTEVCRENGVAYHHGERTVTYTGCVLI